MWSVFLIITNLIGLLAALCMNKYIRFQLLVLYWAISLNVFYIFHNTFFSYVNMKEFFEDWISFVPLIVFIYLSWRKEKKLLYYIEIEKCKI